MNTPIGQSIVAVLANTLFQRVNGHVGVGNDSACSFPWGLRRYALNSAIYCEFATPSITLTIPVYQAIQAIRHFSSARSGLIKPRVAFNTHSPTILPAV